MDVQLSNKSGKKLCLDGFMYVVKVKLQTKIRWECWKQRNWGCPGSITTDQNEENPLNFKDHNHHQELAGIKIVKARN